LTVIEVRRGGKIRELEGGLLESRAAELSRAAVELGVLRTTEKVLRG